MPVLSVLATVWLWSLIPLATKVAYQSFGPGFITFARLLGGTVIFALVELATGRGLRWPPRRASHRLRGPRGIGPRGWAIIAGLGIAADLSLYTLGLRYTTASAATLVVSTDGIILALLGILVLGERGSWLKAGAGATALAGLVVVNWNGQDLGALFGSQYLVGNLLVLGAACCWAAYGLGQRVLAPGPGGGLLPVFVVATALAGLVSLAQAPMPRPLTLPALLALIYLGLGGTGLAYILLARGMARLEAATVGLLGSTLPLFTMVQAHLLMAEAITPYLIAGAALIIAGVAMVMRHQRLYGSNGDDQREDSPA